MQSDNEMLTLTSLKPIAGRIIVQLDKINGMKKCGSIYLVDESSRKSPLRKATVIALGPRTWRGGLLGDGQHDFGIGTRVVIEMKAAKIIPLFEQYRAYILWWTNVLGILESEDAPGYGDLQ